MSGGFFDYQQYRIRDISDTIEQIIEKNGRRKTEDELRNEMWGFSKIKDYLKEYPDSEYHYKHPDDVMQVFKKTVKVLR